MRHGADFSGLSDEPGPPDLTPMKHGAVDIGEINEPEPREPPEASTTVAAVENDLAMHVDFVANSDTDDSSEIELIPVSCIFYTFGCIFIARCNA